MASVSHLIGEAIIAKLATIDGLTVRWFDDNDPEPAVAYLVMGTNSVTARTTSGGGISRTLSGHVGFTYETDTESGAVSTESREAVDELVAEVENAMLELENELDVVPDNEFSFTGTSYGAAGETGGSFTVRIEWECRYRHAATDVRVGA